MNTFQNCKDFQEESEKGELDDMHRRSIISVCSDEEIPMENLDKSKSRYHQTFKIYYKHTFLDVLQVFHGIYLV